MLLHTSRLLLRPLSPDDAGAIYAYRSDAQMNKYQGWIPESLDEVQTFISRNTAEFNSPDSWYQLVIVLQSSSEVIGDVGVHFLSEGSRQVELGCTLNRKFQGNGYATEALAGLITHLFNDLNKHRITASVDPRNHSSMKLMERLKFRREAHFVESLFFRGEWVDDVIYAKLAREWMAESAGHTMKG